jgi:hypothetical protein
MKTQALKTPVIKMISLVRDKLNSFGHANPEVKRLKAKTSRISQFSKKLPVLNDFESRVVAGLQKYGTYITSLEELAANKIDSTELIQAAEQVMPTINFSKENNIYNFIARASEQDFINHPIIPLWGLNESLIKIATNYIGLQVAYRGLLFRKDIPNKVAEDTRMWHVDGEDDKIMKVIVYLNDITIDDGPYEYISKADKSKADIGSRFSGRVADDDMKSLVPSSKWVSCVGKKGTVVFTDPCSIYHRGRVPVSDVARYTLFYAYNSVLPSNPVYANGIFSEKLKAILMNNNKGFDARPLDQAYHYENA